MKEYVLARIKDIYYKYRLLGPNPENYHPAGIDISFLVLEMFSANNNKYAPSINDRIVTCEPGFKWGGNRQAGEASVEFCNPVSARELKEFMARVNEARRDLVKYCERFMHASQ
ncbi:hypothetical protein HYU07_06545 [Candidatus Woesearchaeota archaeon]|nr:hypothetical protein [Candidatus Woesearchaeota archaeon]